MNTKTIKKTAVLCALIFAITTAALERPAFANLDLLTGERARLRRELTVMQWQGKLSDVDAEKVVLGLGSKNEQLIKEAVQVVTIHRTKDLLPLVEELEAVYRVEAKGFQRVPQLVHLVVQAFRQNQDPVGHLRTLLVQAELPQQWMMVESEWPVSLKDMLIDIVAIDEAKRLRQGGKANADLANAQLNDYADKLLHYSKMKPEAAIDHIFNRLRNTTIIGPEQSNLIQVLESYGHTAVTRLTSKLLSVRDLNSLTDYGIMSSFHPVFRYILHHGLATEDAGQANRLIARLEADGSPQVRQSMQTMKETLQRVAQEQASRPVPAAELK